MNYEIHTDLAIEAAGLKNIPPGKSAEGIETTEYKKDYVSVTQVRVISGKGEELTGKPVGNYVTLEVPGLRDSISDAFDQAEQILTHELKKILKLKPEQTVLVVGLGNRFVTPDALGPKVVDKLLVTRHLYGVLPDEITGNMNSLCAVAPGVLGITGIETGEIVAGITRLIKPSAVIVIDALASRCLSRLGCTIQMSDTGICPGSGVGNKRAEISKKTIGVPVISVGIPTVVDAVTLAQDLTGHECERTVNPRSNRFNGNKLCASREHRPRNNTWTYMKAFFRAFIITLISTLIPLITFFIILHTDETTRKIGYDDPSPAFSVTENEITLFGKNLEISSQSDKTKIARSYLTAPIIKLEIEIIQRITENLLRLLK